MNSSHEGDVPTPPTAPDAPAPHKRFRIATARPVTDAAFPKRRFRIAKLEERIAPSKGGKGTHNCSGGGGSTSSGLSGGGSIF